MSCERIQGDLTSKKHVYVVYMTSIKDKFDNINSYKISINEEGLLGIGDF